MMLVWLELILTLQAVRASSLLLTMKITSTVTGISQFLHESQTRTMHCTFHIGQTFKERRINFGIGQQISLKWLKIPLKFINVNLKLALDSLGDTALISDLWSLCQSWILLCLTQTSSLKTHIRHTVISIPRNAWQRALCSKNSSRHAILQVSKMLSSPLQLYLLYYIAEARWSIATTTVSCCNHPLDLGRPFPCKASQDKAQ